MGGACSLVLSCASSGPVELSASSEQVVIYTGYVSEIDTTVAVTLQDGVTNTYMCGGDSNFATHSRWICGDAFSGPEGVDTQLFFEGWVLEGSFYEEEFEGRLGHAKDDQSVEYFELRAVRVKPGDRSGAYISDSINGGCTGVIVLDDPSGGEPTVVGTWCDGSGSYGQVTPVKPVDLDSSVLPFTVDHPSFGEPELVRRVFE